MERNPDGSGLAWVDPDESPEWTDDMFESAEFAVGSRIIREARGTLTRGPGRPRIAEPKQQVSVRLDKDVIEALKAGGPGWQGRMNTVLREWLFKRS